MRRAAWLLPFVLAACSGDPAPTASPPPTTAAPTTAAPSAPATTPAPSATPTTAAPSAGETFTEEEGPAHFRTPTGNIGCYLDDETVRCDISEHTWRMPPKPRDCELDWVAGMGITGRGDIVTGHCAGDTVLGASRVLAYGTGITIGELYCVSRTSGVVCGFLTGDSFQLSRTVARVLPYR